MSAARPLMQRVRLRETVTAADAGRVQALVAGTGFFNSEEILIARELVDEHLSKGPGSGYRFVIADIADEPGGFACFGPAPATESSHHLYWIAVAPAWQGQGVGRALLDRVEALVLAAGGKRLYAETSTRAQYAPTREFYRRTGFSQTAFLPEYFAPGEGKVVFEKGLPGMIANSCAET